MDLGGGRLYAQQFSGQRVLAAADIFDRQGSPVSRYSQLLWGLQGHFRLLFAALGLSNPYTDD